jgi:hypothetical protein
MNLKYYSRHFYPVWTCDECGIDNDMDDAVCTSILCTDMRDDEERNDGVEFLTCEAAAREYKDII